MAKKMEKYPEKFLSKFVELAPGCNLWVSKDKEGNVFVDFDAHGVKQVFKEKRKGNVGGYEYHLAKQSAKFRGGRIEVCYFSDNENDLKGV